MRLARLIAAFVLVQPLLWGAPAAPAAEAGKDYAVLSPAQPTESRGKVEVIEFFAYTCPHCFELEPDLNAWARSLPRNVVLKRQPVIFSDSWEPMARAYFALEALNAVDRLHADVFNALHVDDLKLMDPDAFFDWGAKQGLDRAKLKNAYQSFAVATKVVRAKQLQRAYKINGVPALAVNGKYLTSASMTGSNEKTLAVVDELIRMEGRGARAR
jgi:thiol:disulfide interchange protein DsbA